MEYFVDHVRQMDFAKTEILPEPGDLDETFATVLTNAIFLAQCTPIWKRRADDFERRLRVLEKQLL